MKKKAGKKISCKMNASPPDEDPFLHEISYKLLCKIKSIISNIIKKILEMTLYPELIIQFSDVYIQSTSDEEIYQEYKEKYIKYVITLKFNANILARKQMKESYFQQIPISGNFVTEIYMFFSLTTEQINIKLYYRLIEVNIHEIPRLKKLSIIFQDFIFYILSRQQTPINELLNRSFTAITSIPTPYFDITNFPYDKLRLVTTSIILDIIISLPPIPHIEKPLNKYISNINNFYTFSTSTLFF